MTVHNTQEERPDENADQPDNMTDASAEQKIASVTNLRPTVGDELRLRRGEAGQTIQDVSEAVRIQRRYLEALEDGRLEDLPGTVYALGFLRTYAEYFGFNGDEFVTRFKEETEGQRREQEYSLPEPIEEARVPTAAIVIVAIVLAVGAYVAWYSLRPQDAEVTGAVPEVPAHLATVAEETAPAPAPAVSAPEPEPQPVVTAPVEPEAESPVGMAASPGEPAVAEAPAAVIEAEVPPAPESPPATVETTEIPVAPAEPATPVAEAPPAQAPPAEVSPTAEAPPAEVSSTAEAPPAEAQPAEASPPVEVAAVTPPETVEIDTPSAPVVEEAPHVPQTFGAGGTDSRIVITAAEDSWVEVADAEGNRLLSRTMRTGDSYRVPNREGLVFVTGNAGGLKITVDGAPAPAIGDIGVVRKNVKLDPELLKQGRAWP
jgi:cytoskeleton protein RodZ